MDLAESDIECMSNIFLPHHVKVKREFKDSNRKFIYYTTAETAYRIIKNREIWMRSTLTMNDYMEVRHGLDCVMHAYKSEPGQQLSAALDSCVSGVSKKAFDQFQQWAPAFEIDTFVTCMSEHDHSEDLHGRLSMWRAYGGNAGVAFVLNPAFADQRSTALAAYSSPVAYMGQNEVANQMRQIAQMILSNKDYLAQHGSDKLLSWIFHMLRFASVCTKHPSFAEEREWRVVSSPAVQRSALLPEHIEVVHGIPQTILKLKLENHAEHNIVGLTPAELIERVIIGPCEHPGVIHRAIFQLLEEAGVKNAHSKIVITHVPLRLNKS